MGMEREGGGEGGGGGAGQGVGAGLSASANSLSAVVARHLDRHWRHATSLLQSSRGAAAAEAAAAECEPAWIDTPLRDKFARYAATRADALVAIEPEVHACYTRPNPKPKPRPPPSHTSPIYTQAVTLWAPAQVRATLLADQLDLLADWSGGTPAAAHALLERLRVYCRQAKKAVKEEL